MICSFVGFYSCKFQKLGRFLKNSGNLLLAFRHKNFENRFRNTVGTIIIENRFDDGITQPMTHQFEKSLLPSSRGDLENSKHLLNLMNFKPSFEIKADKRADLPGQLPNFTANFPLIIKCL